MSIATIKRTFTGWREQGFSGGAWPVLMAALLLGGCSSTEMFYRNADWMLERYAVKTLDVNEDQLNGWSPDLERVLNQHLNWEVPILERYLQLTARAVDELPGKRLDAACLVGGAVRIFTRHARLAADLSAPLLVKLSRSQVDHLAGYLADRRARFRERYLKGDESEQQQARVVRLTERLESWTGSLNGRQQARIAELVASLRGVTANWLAHRTQQEERLLQLLREGADAEGVHAQLLNWWLPWAGEAKGFADQWVNVEAAFVRLFDDLAVSLTDRQREHFVSKVSSLERDLARLHGDTPRAVGEIPGGLPCFGRQI